MYKNILYVGPYREFSGAGNAARNYIEALFKAGHDVCIAPMYFTGDVYPENEISSNILPLENNQLNHYDLVIQHCHPFDYVYSNKFDKNIGIYQFNVANIHPSLVSRLDLMDQIIVNSKFNANVLKNMCRGSVAKKIKVVPELIDLGLANQTYIEYPWAKTDNRPIIFYTIGDFIERKNLHKIIKAFLYLFNNYDNIELVIKTKPHYSHNNSELIHKELEYSIDKIYRSLKLNKKTSKPLKIMIGSFDHKYLLALHKNANIYIDASKAENFGYTVLEAALFDNYLITNANSSTSEISKNCLPTTSKPVETEDSYSVNFVENNPNHYWYDVSFDSLCDNMTKAYMSAISEPKTRHELSQYSYETIENIL